MRRSVRLHHRRAAVPLALALATGLLLFVPVVATAAPQPVTMRPAANVPIGFATNRTAVADFNGDGKLDVAAVGWSEHKVSVLLGNGSGGFAAGPGSPILIGGLGMGIVCGDVNKDAKVDLVVSRLNGVEVLLGNGSGGFAPAPGSPIAVAQAYGPAIGDVNSDGNPDLVVTSAISPGVVNVLLGTGAGSFAPVAGSPFAVGGNNPLGLVLADFNKDGKLDVATANNTTPGSVSLLIGTGGGVFAPVAGSPFAAGNGSMGLALGDFNKDGNLDLATANYLGGSTSVFLGNGSGGLAPKVDYTTLPHTRSLAVGDFNGDGNDDLVTSSLDSGAVTVRVGDGTGTFTGTYGFSTGTTQSASVSVGDFTSDGKPDVLAALTTGANSALLVDSTVFPPTGTLTIAGGKTAVNKTTVTLDSTGIKNAAEMRLRSGSQDWSSWVPFAASTPWTLVGTDGLKTIQAEYRNAGVVVLPAQVSVFLDRKRPTSTVGYSASVKKGHKVSLRFKIKDPSPSCGNAGVRLKFYRRGKLKLTLLLPAQKTNQKDTYVWTATLARGRYAVKVVATDIAGNKCPARRVGAAMVLVK